MSGRVRQGVIALSGRRNPVDIGGELAARLHPGTVEAFARLAPFDQHHLVEVADQLRRNGAPGPLVIAGLLHDIGKAAGSRPPTILERAAIVIARRAAPALVSALRRRSTAPRGLEGAWVVACHARLGGDMLRRLGYDDHICALVPSHDDPACWSNDLEMLRGVDDRMGHRSTRASVTASDTAREQTIAQQLSGRGPSSSGPLRKQNERRFPASATRTTSERRCRGRTR